MRYLIDENRYIVSDVNKSIKKLPPGNYIPRYDSMSKQFWFETFNITSDNILDLPSKEYEQTLNEMENFLKADIKSLYKDLGFLYKRSMLLYGNPGTGKTCLVNRLARKVTSLGGICLFIKDPTYLEMAYQILEQTQPETFITVMLEEFDYIVKHNESMLLTLLDGQVQKNNVMYLATTNYLDRIPKRICRPGRINKLLEIKYPDAKAREFYFKTKLNDENIYKSWISKTENLSIDDLKEVIQAVYILNADLDETVARLKSNKKELKEEKDRDYDDDYEDSVFNGLMKNIRDNEYKLTRSKK